MGIVQYNEGQNKTKRLRKVNFLSLVELQYPSSLVLGDCTPGSWAFGLELNYTTSFPGLRLTKKQMMGLLSLH